MKTDVFKFCQHNFQKKESQKHESLKEEGITNMETIMGLSYIAGLMSCLAIYEFCKLLGLVGALV